jgi:hypothetical protein
MGRRDSRGNELPATCAVSLCTACKQAVAPNSPPSSVRMRTSAPSARGEAPSAFLPAGIDYFGRDEHLDVQFRKLCVVHE